MFPMCSLYCMFSPGCHESAKSQFFPKPPTALRPVVPGGRQWMLLQRAQGSDQARSAASAARFTTVGVEMEFHPPKWGYYTVIPFKEMVINGCYWNYPSI